MLKYLLMDDAGMPGDGVTMPTDDNVANNDGGGDADPTNEGGSEHTPMMPGSETPKGDTPMDEQPGM